MVTEYKEDPEYVLKTRYTVPVACRMHLKMSCPVCAKDRVHSHWGKPLKGQRGFYCRKCRSKLIDGRLFTAL